MKNKKEKKVSQKLPSSDLRMQIKFLKSVVENLINKLAVPIVDLLVKKKDVNEFLIAKKLELTINQTRNILYKLSDYGLVSFIRKKDKRKGWYIYFWTLNVYQSLFLLEKTLKKELENLETQLKNRKEKRYYSCDICSIEVNEETALLNDFICSECGEVYTLSNNNKLIVELEKEVKKIKREIIFVCNERNFEEQKLEKKKSRKIIKAEKERKESRRIKISKTKAEKKAKKDEEDKKNKKNKQDRKDRKDKKDKKDKKVVKKKIKKTKKIIKKNSRKTKLKKK